MIKQFLSNLKFTRLSMIIGAFVMTASVWALWRRLSPWQFFKNSPEQINLSEQIDPTVAEKIRLFPGKLVATFGGGDAFAQMPVLNLGNNAGSTGYIDFIQPTDMSHSVMWGVDIHERPFVSFKLTVTINTGDDTAVQEKTYVETLFQRYSDNKDCWTTGGQIYFDRMARSVLQDASEAQNGKATLTPGFLSYIKRLNARETLSATVNDINRKKTYQIRLAD